MQDIMKIPRSRRNEGNPRARITQFKESLTKTMKSWPRDALDRMVNEEDKGFLRSMMSSRTATMAGVDKSLVVTERNVKKRKEHQAKRSGKEKKRQESDQHRSVNSTEAIPSGTFDPPEDRDNDVQYLPRQSQFETPHRRLKKTGTEVHIPHDILKSEALVSTAVRNNISPTALAATVTSLVEACKGDTSRINLNATQSYR